MTRKAIFAAAAAAIALTVSACGSSSSSSPTSAAAAPASSGAAAAGSSAPAASGSTIASKFILGGPAEFKTRVDGLPGLTKNYGVTFGKYTVTDTGGPVTVTALKNGQIDAADLFTTDPSIAANGFVILADPKSNFAAQNILPIITKTKATPGVTKVLNAISAKLTTAEVSTLMVQVVTNKQDPDAVALKWLNDNGLAPKSTDAAGITLVVGSANFQENVLLADMYAEALKAAGATVTTKLNIGSREKYLPGLKSGSIDLLPEYNGSILQALDPTATATSPADVFTALQKALPSNLTVLTQSDAQDSDAIVVTKATADKYSLKSIADLAKAAS